MRAIIFSSLAFLAGIIAAAGCNVETVLHELDRQQSPRAGQVHALPPGETIRIASFNIQVMGQSKIDKPQVMQVLTDVIKRYDVVAVQELRSKEQDVIPRWLAMINADGSRWDALVGPRLGRTVSKEQYVFLYNQDTVAFVPQSDYTINDPNDLLHREPYVASFQALAPAGVEPFTFTLINIHTDPDETDQELDALAEVFHVVRQSNPAEDDVILLGDLNVDYTRLGLLGQIPNIVCTVQGEPTNTRMNKSYDNIIFDRTTTTEFSGECGVLNLLSEYQLSEAEALDVSDHLPVWATFSVAEDTADSVATAAQPARR